MRATYDETVELGDGRTGVVVGIGAQLTPPYARRYFVRLNGTDEAGEEVSVAENEIARLVYAAPPSLAPPGQRERTLTEYRDAIEAEGPNASYYVPRG